MVANTPVANRIAIAGPPTTKPATAAATTPPIANSHTRSAGRGSAAGCTKAANQAGQGCTVELHSPPVLGSDRWAQPGRRRGGRTQVVAAATTVAAMSSAGITVMAARPLV